MTGSTPCPAVGITLLGGSASPGGWRSQHAAGGRGQDWTGAGSGVGAGRSQHSGVGFPPAPPSLQTPAAAGWGISCTTLDSFVVSSTHLRKEKHGRVCAGGGFP